MDAEREKPPCAEVRAACQNLAAIAAAYAEATGTPLKTVGRKFYGRGDFFTKSTLADGTEPPSLKSVGAMLDKFREEWPPGAPWPFLRPIVFAPPPRREKAGGKRPRRG
jgi:hypothetical protein